MIANPFLGVVFHWLGGLASGSFYVPYRFVRKWSWEVYWLVGGFFSWIIAPWVLASIKTNDLLVVLSSAPGSSLGWAYFWGAMWGLGGLTFGLTMRYLGMSLGMGVALGYCAVFGTLMPPIFHGEFMPKILGTVSGQVILVGVVICVLGIAVAGMAGMSKERELSEEQKRATIKEFNFARGILVATFSGVMSASFAYGLDAATPIARPVASARHAGALDGPAQIVRCAAGRVHIELHLVRLPEHSEPDGLPVLQSHAAGGCPGTRAVPASESGGGARRANRSSNSPRGRPTAPMPCRC